jgi:hypothetical protein
MGNAIDDTLCNIRQGLIKRRLEPAHVPWGTVLTTVSVTLSEGNEGQRTSGQGLGEEKQEGNMRYSSCNSPGDIWNQSVMSKLR